MISLISIIYSAFKFQKNINAHPILIKIKESKTETLSSMNLNLSYFAINLTTIKVLLFMIGL
jgi:hypothetical protein